jgi:hypothetical protein
MIETSNIHVKKKSDEMAVVIVPDAVVNPRTMMIYDKIVSPPDFKSQDHQPIRRTQLDVENILSA